MALSTVPPEPDPPGLDQWAASDREGITTVFCDIDDTLTRDNLLASEAFDAVWRLSKAGFRVVPVTGRPAGWCDCIIRQWPVDAIIGENGAFAYYLQGGVRRELYHPDAGLPGENAKALAAIADLVYREVPGTRGAKDQPFRQFDIAVDFREEPPYLDLDAAERIAGIFRDNGAIAKISSIHVNAWMGRYDKRSMTVLTARQLWGLDLEGEAGRRSVTFCGDSPNDEPMFAFFPFSCAVANVRDTLKYMTHYPAFVTGKAHGPGFAELADSLLAAQGSRDPGRDPGVGTRI